MKNRKYTDPFENLPTLERTIIKLRTNEIVLVLYYTEEIKRSVLDMVLHREKFLARMDSSNTQRISAKTKNKLKIALNIMVEDGAISNAERLMIEDFGNFRNDIGHRMDHLFADLEQSRFSSWNYDEEMREQFGIKQFDHSAFWQMEKIETLLNRVMRSHYRFLTFSIRGHALFSSTRKVLEREIATIRKRLMRLSNQRKREIADLNSELSKGFELLRALHEKQYFSIRHERGRMTARGEEFCYRLFDEGISDLAVAHIFEMKLYSIRLRRRKWINAGKS